MPTDTNKLLWAFRAIELPQELTMKLQSLQEDMKRSNPAGVKWVEAHNIHLTLKFLDAISESTMNRIIDALKAICPLYSLFSLETSTLGAFPNIQRPKVFWLGLNGNLTPLITLQKAIDVGLTPLGFSPENRPFSPHLTLARLRDGIAPSVQRAFGDLILKTGWQGGETWIVKKITLMKSQLLPSGPVYSRLAEIRLGKSEYPFSNLHD